MVLKRKMGEKEKRNVLHWSSSMYSIGDFPLLFFLPFLPPPSLLYFHFLLSFSFCFHFISLSVQKQHYIETWNLFQPKKKRIDILSSLSVIRRWLRSSLSSCWDPSTSVSGSALWQLDNESRLAACREECSASLFFPRNIRVPSMPRTEVTFFFLFAVSHGTTKGPGFLLSIMMKWGGGARKSLIPNERMQLEEMEAKGSTARDRPSFY